MAAAGVGALHEKINPNNNNEQQPASLTLGVCMTLATAAFGVRAFASCELRECQSSVYKTLFPPASVGLLRFYAQSLYTLIINGVIIIMRLHCVCLCRDDRRWWSG